MFISFILIRVFKAPCVGTKVNDAGFFHVIAIIEAGSIPGHVVNRYSGTWQTLGYFIPDVFKSDGGVVVDPAPPFHSEHGLNIG